MAPELLLKKSLLCPLAWFLVLGAGSLHRGSPVSLGAAVFAQPGLEAEGCCSLWILSQGLPEVKARQSKAVLLGGLQGWAEVLNHIPYLCILCLLPWCCQDIQQFHSLDCASDGGKNLLSPVFAVCFI